MKTKICTKCKKELPRDPDHFHRLSNSKDGLRSRCKVCIGGKYTDYLDIPNIKEGYKWCNKCKKQLPKNSDYFHKNVNMKDGFKNYCKRCSGYNYTNKIPKVKGNKICSVCNQEKPYNSNYFYVDKSRKNGLSYSCKICDNKRGLYYRLFNRERYLKLKRKSDKDYRENNKNKISERHRIWRENPDNQINIRVIDQRYRARKKKLPNTLTIDEYEDTLRYFNNVCAYCGMSNKDHLEEYGESLHQEHIIPLSKGGGYVKENIIPSCRNCNSSKSNTDLGKWYKDSGIYNKEKYNKILEFIKIHS